MTSKCKFAYLWRMTRQPTCSGAPCSCSTDC